MGTKCTPLNALKPSSGLALLLVFVCIKSSSFAFGVGLSNKHFDRKQSLKINSLLECSTGIVKLVPLMI